jgi:hypothetical protein
MHLLFGECWSCGWPACANFSTELRTIELHHVFAGTVGRSDEFTNCAMLCSDCHRKVNTPELPTGRILYLCWKFNRQHLSWVRMALLARHHLPDLITD